MIPKKIHYCWFGRNEKPKLAKKCIESWRKFCPDFEIIEWNEDNFDVNMNVYTRYCYENKKWAYLSDFARLYVVAENGGIYFDTDVELVKPLDVLLGFEAFYGFETEKYVATGLGFGAEKNHPTIISMVEEYEKLMKEPTESFTFVTCPIHNTEALIKFGFVGNGKRQTVCGAEIFPIEYFNPYDDPTGKLNKTRNTVSIHWYSKSWMNKSTILRSKLTKPFHRLFGNDCFGWIKRIIK